MTVNVECFGDDGWAYEVNMKPRLILKRTISQQNKNPTTRSK